ncbi:MAG: Rrf2 family transcriptional regulator [Bacteroidetes bacterium]|nr:Rrf2 family transcriptional regulator [Bacteroidota bacterium]
MFSKSCEYGIKAIIYIANQSLQKRRVKLQDIIGEVGSPEAFTAKILQELARNKIIISHTGPYGGFEMDVKNMKKVRLSEIVYAIDGDAIYNGCGLGLTACSASQPCPIHHKFVKVRNELKIMLETTTIYDLAVGHKNAATFLRR